jgi:hypothetical protein
LPIVAPIKLAGEGRELVPRVEVTTAV